MKKTILAALILLLGGGAFAQNSNGRNEPRPTPSWWVRLLGLNDTSDRIGIAERNRGYRKPTAPESGATEPVYDGLGAGTDDAEYLTGPAQNNH